MSLPFKFILLLLFNILLNSSSSSKIGYNDSAIFVLLNKRQFYTNFKRTRTHYSSNVNAFTRKRDQPPISSSLQTNNISIHIDNNQRRTNQLSHSTRRDSAKLYTDGGQDNSDAAHLDYLDLRVHQLGERQELALLRRARERKRYLYLNTYGRLLTYVLFTCVVSYRCNNMATLRWRNAQLSQNKICFELGNLTKFKKRIYCI